eukprot:1355766-Amphidinium_carterae.1
MDGELSEVASVLSGTCVAAGGASRARAVNERPTMLEGELFAEVHAVSSLTLLHGLGIIAVVKAVLLVLVEVVESNSHF